MEFQVGMPKPVRFLCRDGTVELKPVHMEKLEMLGLECERMGVINLRNIDIYKDIASDFLRIIDRISRRDDGEFVVNASGLQMTYTHLLEMNRIVDLLSIRGLDFVLKALIASSASGTSALRCFGNTLRSSDVGEWLGRNFSKDDVSDFILQLGYKANDALRKSCLIGWLLDSSPDFCFFQGGHIYVGDVDGKYKIIHVERGGISSFRNELKWTIRALKYRDQKEHLCDLVPEFLRVARDRVGNSQRPVSEYSNVSELAIARRLKVLAYGENQFIIGRANKLELWDFSSEEISIFHYPEFPIDIDFIQLLPNDLMLVVLGRAIFIFGITTKELPFCAKMFSLKSNGLDSSVLHSELLHDTCREMCYPWRLFIKGRGGLVLHLSTQEMF